MAKTKAEIQRDYAKRTNYAADIRSMKKNTIVLGVRLGLNTEQDLIEWLGSQTNKAGYIKRLIREDMAKIKEENI